MLKIILLQLQEAHSIVFFMETAIVAAISKFDVVHAEQSCTISTMARGLVS